MLKLSRYLIHYTSQYYFLPKKDMMFPCPALVSIFLFLADDGAVETGVLSRGKGSSSEKDSQANSSFVTMRGAYQHSPYATRSSGLIT